jgi:hypothetical protein
LSFHHTHHTTTQRKYPKIKITEKNPLILGLKLKQVRNAQRNNETYLLQGLMYGCGGCGGGECGLFENNSNV